MPRNETTLRIAGSERELIERLILALEANAKAMGQASKKKVPEKVPSYGSPLKAIKDSDG